MDPMISGIIVGLVGWYLALTRKNPDYGIWAKELQELNDLKDQAAKNLAEAKALVEKNCVMSPEAIHEIITLLNELVQDGVPVGSTLDKTIRKLAEEKIINADAVVRTSQGLKLVKS